MCTSHQKYILKGVILMPVTLPSNAEHYQYQVTVDNTYGEAG